jgi:hypothetical protein
MYPKVNKKQLVYSIYCICTAEEYQISLHHFPLSVSCLRTDILCKCLWKKCTFSQMLYVIPEARNSYFFKEQSWVLSSPGALIGKNFNHSLKRICVCELLHLTDAYEFYRV